MKERERERERERENNRISNAREEVLLAVDQ